MIPTSENGAYCNLRKTEAKLTSATPTNTTALESRNGIRFFGFSSWVQAFALLTFGVATNDFARAQPAADNGAMDAKIQQFCSDCHSMPKASSFPRDAWYDEVRLAYELYARSGRSDLTPPPLAEVVQYFRKRAPEQIIFPDAQPIDALWRARFETTKLDWSETQYVTPAISYLKWITLDGGKSFRILVSDMRDGSLSLVNPDPNNTSRIVLARLGNPARFDVADIDHDGLTDVIIADLGSFNPYDHGFGQIVLVQQTTEGKFVSLPLATGLGRIADVKVADFDDDGSLDILAAEFGHRQTGGIHLLTNTNTDSSGARPTYTRRRLDMRPGTIQLHPLDWDSDGKLDFAALVSQQFETVDLFLNRGQRFNRREIFGADDLSFGSVGIEPCDFDGDGDLDLLHVNGDCFDNTFANTSHGISWLENRDNLSFHYHRIADLPGAYRALPGDFDGDGDLDVVTVSNLPASVKPTSLSEQTTASITLLERLDDNRFVTHVLQTGTARYPALEVADFDQDGRLDFAVGAQLFGSDAVGSPAASLPRLTIWWNRN